MNRINWNKKKTYDLIFFAGLVIALTLIYNAGTNIDITKINLVWRRILLVMAAFIILSSWLITGNPLFGWLVNEQNRISLSRLQMFLWTVVILSAFMTAVFANLKFGHINKAIDILIPQELWVAMGISTASLVGTGLILENKKDKHPKKVELKQVQGRNGLLVTKEKPSLLDLIRGEEISNNKTIDPTRLQNLFFTFVLVGVYMANLSALFAKVATTEVSELVKDLPIGAFPELGASTVTLLTISHAGYLVAKAIDKEPAETSEENKPSTPVEPVG